MAMIGYSPLIYTAAFLKGNHCESVLHGTCIGRLESRCRGDLTSDKIQSNYGNITVITVWGE